MAEQQQKSRSKSLYRGISVETQPLITKLENPPATKKFYSSPKFWLKPSTTDSEGKEIPAKDYFILASAGVDKLGVLAYDFDKDTWETWKDYPKGVNPHLAVANIDYDKNLLYLSHGKKPLLAILDLVKKEWTVTVSGIDYDTSEDEKNVYGTGKGRILPNGEYHLIITSKKRNRHLKYDAENNKFIAVSQCAIDNNCNFRTSGAIAYIESKKYLLQLGTIYIH